MEKNTTNEKLDVLKKRLFDITSDEVKKAFKPVDVQLQKIKRGTGTKQSTMYRATLLFIPGVYELPIMLSQMEYNQICIKRNPNSAAAIPDSLKLKAYILPVEYTNVNSITEEIKTSFQVKVILSDLVRKKIWLDQLQKSMWEILVKLPFIKAENDVDGEEIIADAI